MPVDPKALILLDFRHKKRRPWTSFFVDLVGRCHLNLLSKLLIYKINIDFSFWLKYQLECRAKLATRLHSI